MRWYPPGTILMQNPSFRSRVRRPSLRWSWICLLWYPPGTICMQTPSVRSLVRRFPSRRIPETALSSGIPPLPASHFPLGLLTHEVPRPDIRFKYQDVEPTGSVSSASPSILNTRIEVKDERTFSCPASPFVINTALRLMARGFPVAVVQGSSFAPEVLAPLKPL